MKKNRKLLSVMAMSLAFTVLFSLVAFAGTETTINVGSNATPDNIGLDWPNEQCSVLVTGLTEGEETTILVYKDVALSDLTNSDVLYVAQAPADNSGQVTFTFMLRGSGSSMTSEWFSYYAGDNDIKVAVNSANSDSEPKYSLITVAYGDEINAIDINWSNVVVGANISNLDVNVDYKNATDATIKATAENGIAVTGFSTGEAATFSDVSVVLTTPNDKTKSVKKVVTVKPANAGDPVATNVTFTFNVANEDPDVKENLSVYEDGAIKLPDAPAYTPENKIFIGWAKKDGNDVSAIYPAGGTVAASDLTSNANVAFDAKWIDYKADGNDASVKMVDGASLRVHGKPYGMRFTTNFDGSFYSDLVQAIPDADVITYGTIIAPKDYIDALPEGAEFTIADLEANSKTYLNIVHSQFAKQEINTATGATTDISEALNKTINSVISNIKPKNYDRVFSARAYMKLTFADGVEMYFYTSSDNSAKVSKVAKDALADTDYVTYVNGLDNAAEITALLQAYSAAYTAE